MSTAFDIHRKLTLEDMRTIPMDTLFEHLDWLASETDKVLDAGERAMSEFETVLSAPRTPEEDAFIKSDSDDWYRRTAPNVASIEDGAVAFFSKRMSEPRPTFGVRV